MKLGNSFVTQKTGPLPNWAWMGLGLGAALVYSAVKGNMKKSADAAADAADNGTGVVQKYPAGVLPPTYAFVDADTTLVTQNAFPPGGGRPPRPNPPPVAPTPTPAPDGQYVTVTRWTRKNAPWSSTLSGIAGHLWGTGDAWRAIWNAPQNASLKSSRKQPDEIQPGDKVWVPAAPPASGGDNPSGHRWSSHDDRRKRSNR